MGFYRDRPIPKPERLVLGAIIIKEIEREELVEALFGADPFLIDHDCLNPSGHDAIASCGEIVCCHCAKVFWR